MTLEELIKNGTHDAIERAARAISLSFREEGFDPEHDDRSVWEEFRRAAKAVLSEFKGDELPECMMPDGGAPCGGYVSIYGHLMDTRRRLDRIAAIIEHVDNRCMAADGPVTPTLHEMTQAEMSEIYRLASSGKP